MTYGIRTRPAAPTTRGATTTPRPTWISPRYDNSSPALQDMPFRQAAKGGGPGQASGSEGSGSVGRDGGVRGVRLRETRGHDWQNGKGVEVIESRETKSPASGWKQGGGKSLDLCGFQASGGLVLLRWGAGLSARVIPKYDSGRLPCFAEPMTRHQPMETSETRTSWLMVWDRWRRIGVE